MSYNYETRTSVANEFIRSFTYYHNDKIIKIITDASKYLNPQSSDELRAEFTNFLNEFDKLMLTPENIPDDDEDIRERESDIFHSIINEINRFNNNIFAIFITGINYDKISKKKITDNNYKFIILNKYLQKKKKNERCSAYELLTKKSCSIDCESEKSIKLFSPYGLVYSMIRQLRNVDEHSLDVNSRHTLRKSGKPFEYGHYVLDPITSGRSCGNTYSIIGVLIMSIYHFVENLQIWIDTFNAD